MKKNDVLELVSQELLPALDKEIQRTRELEKWSQQGGKKPVLPSNAEREHKALADLAMTPWLGLIPRVSAQQLKVDGVYSPDRSDESLAQFWGPWQTNNMRTLQHTVHRSALSFGMGFVSAVPGDRGAVFRAYSTAQMLPVYQDPAHDEFPMFALRMETLPNGDRMLFLLDETTEHILSVEKRTDKWAYITLSDHNVGVCPVVRYAEEIDTEGRSPGEIERLVTVGSRINKTVYDRLLTQHYNSWKVRTATGLDDTMSDSEAEQLKMKLRQNDILTGGEGVSFGTLAETALDPFVKAKESDLEDISAVSQTPMSALGKMVNVGNDGVAETKSGLRAKTRLRQDSFGASHVQLLRLASHIEGRKADSEDFTIEAHWKTLDIDLLAQEADAYGKMAGMLGVPVEKLWEKFSTISKPEAQSWARYREDHPTADEITARSIAGQLESVL